MAGGADCLQDQRVSRGITHAQGRMGRKARLPDHRQAVLRPEQEPDRQPVYRRSGGTGNRQEPVDHRRRGGRGDEEDEIRQQRRGFGRAGR